MFLDYFVFHAISYGGYFYVCTYVRLQKEIPSVGVQGKADRLGLFDCRGGKVYTVSQTVDRLLNVF